MTYLSELDLFIVYSIHTTLCLMESDFELQTAIGGGGGDIEKKINHGGGDGGDDDGGDDDDYFDDFDEGDEGDDGLFRRRMFLEEVWL